MMRQVRTRMMIPFLFVASLVWHAKLVEAFNIFGGGSSASTSASFNNIPTTTTSTDADDEPIQIRIRSTRESDIATVASFLSSPSSSNDGTTNTGAWNTFKSQLDQMQANMEITSLLKGRAAVLREGKKTYNRFLQEIKQQQQSSSLESSASSAAPPPPLLSPHELLQLWWNRPYNHAFKTLLEKASQQTGEPNVWQGHNFALTPPEPAWLRHVQMTATATLAIEVEATKQEKDKRPRIENNNKEIIVGFCEVALLENPLLLHADIENHADNNNNNNKNNTDNNIDDDDNNNNNALFRPAITNLATAPAYRRRGIAQRLLLATERYVRQYWYDDSSSSSSSSTTTNIGGGGSSSSNSNNDESSSSSSSSASSSSLGLFVEQDNTAAINLYEKMGYRRTVACSGGSQLGEMWYMVKDFEANTKNDIKKPTTTNTNTNDAHSLSLSAMASRDECNGTTETMEEEIPLQAAKVNGSSSSSSSSSAEATLSEMPTSTRTTK